MFSVFIDTILVCTATAMMCLSSGIVPSEELTGAPFVQTALAFFTVTDVLIILQIVK